MGKEEKYAIRKRQRKNAQSDTERKGAHEKVKAGHFPHFQDLFAEVTSPYSDYFGIDPYPVWKKGKQ